MNENTIRKIIREEIERANSSEIIPLISTEDLSKLLNISTATLDTWRSKDKGPRSTKIGGRVMYKIAEVNEWIENQ